MNPALASLDRHGLLPPRFLKVTVTGQCNLRCRHCWPESGPGGSSPVPAETVQNLLEEFVALGGTGVSITGGEPLTHPQWREILRETCRLDGLHRVELQTNATLLDAGAVAFVQTLAAPHLAVRISLDGARRETNDAVRGAGTFDAVLSALGRLASHGMAARVVLSMTETDANLPEIPELLQLGERFGVARVETATLLARGRATGGGAPRGPRPDQAAALLQRYAQDEVFRRRYRDRGCTAALEWARWYPQRREHCCNFVENPFVDVYGRLFPCAMYEWEDAAVEGVFRRPLADVLRAGAATWGRLRRASRERLAEPGPCAGCRGWCHCGGGCFGRSIGPDAETGGREDRCALRRAVYAACS